MHSVTLRCTLHCTYKGTMLFAIWFSFLENVASEEHFCPQKKSSFCEVKMRSAIKFPVFRFSKMGTTHCTLFEICLPKMYGGYNKLSWNHELKQRYNFLQNAVSKVQFLSKWKTKILKKSKKIERYNVFQKSKQVQCLGTMQCNAMPVTNVSRNKHLRGNRKMHKSIFFIRVRSDFHEKLVKNKNPVARELKN